ncbi:MAG TPA: hypothetical protein VFW98_02755 [Gemmatimonadaceae bacterium]|nr:hypothetical protein [Gemmatimonadaceae bacterium]
MKPSSLAITTVLLLAACTHAPEPPAAKLAPLPPTPLANLASQHVVLLPTQYLRPADSLGWAAQIPNPRAYLTGMDAELTFALQQRGLKGVWAFPEAVARSARRNPTYASDPYALSAEWLRPPVGRLPDQIPNPLASQLRTLVALNNARYVLLPVEVRFVKTPGGGRAVLHLVLIDSRLNRVLWMHDVVSQPAASFSPALAASLASRTADLIVAAR